MIDSTLMVPGTPHRAAEDWAAPDDYLTWSQVTSLLRRRWLLIAIVTALGAGGALLYGAKKAPVYEASAVLQLEKDQYNLPEMVTSRATDEGELSTQLEVLQSSGLAATVVRDLALNVSVSEGPLSRSRLFSTVAVSNETVPGTVTLTRTGAGQYAAVHSETGERIEGIVPGRPVAIGGLTFAMRPVAGEPETLTLEVASIPAAVQLFQQQLRVGRGDRNANTIWLRYRSDDPQLARAGADLLAQRYISQRADAARAKVRTAISFLSDEADTLRRKMQSADLALQDFRQREGVVSLADEATSAVTQSATLRTARATMEAERSALQQLVGQADTGASAYRRLTAFPTLIGNPTVANLLHSLDDLEGQRTTLLVQRTPRDPDVQALTRRIGDADAQLRGITLTYLSGLQKQVASLDQALNAQARVAAGIPGKSMAEDQLSRAPKVLSDVYTLVETRLQEARLAETAATAGVALIDAPSLPTAPVWPRRGLLLAVGVVLGLLCGVAIAWLREGMDASIHSRADVTRAAELPVLTVVPHIRISQPATRGTVSVTVPSPVRQLAPWHAPSRRTRLLDERPAHAAAREAYTWLETSLAMSQDGSEAQTVVFTSALAREGKTVSAANLAVSAAQHGRRVLLIDADLRRGSAHEVFGIPSGPGLAEVLAGSLPLESVMREVVVKDGVVVDVISRGERASHPAMLLKSARLHALLATVKGDHDLVIIDSPPVNLVSDPLLLVRQVDGVILVARAGITDSAALSEAVRHLRDVGAPLLGVLLNDINLRRDSSYDDSYRYLDQAGSYATAGEA